MPLNHKDFHYYFSVPRSAFNRHKKLFKGCDLLVTYAVLKDDTKGEFIGDLKQHDGRVMLDSGGFTNQHTPGTVKFEAWRDFVKDNKGWLDEYIQFDVIGNRAKTVEKYHEARKAGLAPIFVHHLRLRSMMDAVQKRYVEDDKVALAGYGKITPEQGKRTDMDVAQFEPEAFTWLKQNRTMAHLLAPSSVKRYLPYLDLIHSVDSATWCKSSYYGQTRIFEWGKIGDFRVPLLRAYGFPGLRIPSNHKAIPQDRLQADYHNVIRRYGYQDATAVVKSQVAAIFHIKRYIAALKQFDCSSLRSWMIEEGKIKDVARKHFDLAVGKDRETAVINSGSNLGLEAIELKQVLSAYDRAILLRSPAVTIVGSTVTQGKTENDVDLLVHGPLDDRTRKVIEFRLGRALPPEISKRTQFHDEELGGPFTDYTHLYDLALVPHKHAGEVVQMAEKADDPFLDWPKAPGKRPAVVQLHSRGRSVHMDLRIKVNGHLVGWTLFAQKPNAAPDIETVAQARDLYRGYTAGTGNRYFKPILAPSKMQGTGKLRQPTDWLEVEGAVVGEGEIGATAREKGVVAAVARPKAEWGLQLPHFHEYFLSGDSVWQGPLYTRLLVGGAGSPGGAQTPEGQPFWTLWLSKSALPSVLGPRAVEKGHMPPVGQSAMPETLMAVTPKEYRFWEEPTEERARTVRDSLVESKFFTEDNTRIVDGQFRRIVTKRWVFEPAGLPPVIEDDAEDDVEKAGIWRAATSKARLAKRIASMIPRHKTYVEPFACTGAVLFAKEPSEHEAVGDLDKEIAHAFALCSRITADQIKQLRARDWTGDKARHKRLVKETPTSDIDRLFRFLYLRRFAYFGMWDHFNPKEQGVDGSGQVDKLERLAPRLKDVHVHHADYEKLVEKYDGPDTFFFFDPPYAATKPGHTLGQADGTSFDEERFVKVLKSIKGKFLVTYGTRGRLAKLMKDAGFKVKAFRSRRTIRRIADADQSEWLTQYFGSNYEKAEKSEALTVRYTLSWLFWRGPMVSRTGPSRQVWLLMLDDGSTGLAGWELQADPRDESPVSALRRKWKGKGLLAADQNVKPGEAIDGNVLNPTKDTPAWLRVQEHGEAQVETDGEKIILEIGSGRMKGRWAVTPEEKDSTIWVLERLAEKAEDETAKADGPGRTDLKPGDRFLPMKPRAGENLGEFKEIEEAVKRWATPELLRDQGVAVEPKWNGMRTIAGKTEDGKVFLWFEDSKDDRTKILPTIVGVLDGIPGSFILDSELLDHRPDGSTLPRSSLARFTGPVKPQDDGRVMLHAFRLLFWDKAGGNLTAQDEAENHSALARFLAMANEKGAKGRIVQTDRKIARTVEQLEQHVAWARKMDGSEGAMLKRLDATYSLGGNTSSWVKLKSIRRVYALVLSRSKVSGSDHTWNYDCAVGPLPEGGAGFKQTVTWKGKTYAPIGRTANTNVQAKPGDIIQVSFFELQVDRKPGERRVHWFGPAQVELLRDDKSQPSSLEEVERLATANEVRKVLIDSGAKRISFVKTAEERYVLGIVLEPTDGQDGAQMKPDSQGDIYSKAEVRQAAHRFMEEFRNIGLMHRSLVNGRVKILESFVVPEGTGGFTIKDPDGQKQFVQEGTWLLGLRVADDELWQQVKTGALSGLSIGGSARRVKPRT